MNGDDPRLARELEDTVQFLKDHGFRHILNNQRAQAFYSKWLSQYGDDSIAQVTGTHVIVWGISQVAMKFIEDQRVGLEPIEKSTRYVNFGSKVGGRYLYYIPKPDLNRHGLLGEYPAVMDQLFDTYVALLPRLQDWLRNNFEEKDSILEKKAFDTLRGLLPMATLGQVAFRGNAQAFEYLINRTARHPLGELRWFANEIKTELDKEIPSLLLRVSDEKSKDYQNYLNGRYDAVRRFLGPDEPQPNLDIVRRPEVRLVEFDPESETKILAGIVFQQTHCQLGRGDGQGQVAVDRGKTRTASAVPAEPFCAMAKSRTSFRKCLPALRDRDGYRLVSRSASAPHDDAGTPDLFHVPWLQHSARAAAGRPGSNRSKKRWSAPISFSGSWNRSIGIWRNMSSRWRIACVFISGRTSGSCSGRRN